MRRLKDAEIEMEKQTGVKIKIVEKVGTKLVDMLHKAGRDRIVEEQVVSSAPPRQRQEETWSRIARKEMWYMRLGAEPVRK